MIINHTNEMYKMSIVLNVLNRVSLLQILSSYGIIDFVMLIIKNLIAREELVYFQVMR